MTTDTTTDTTASTVPLRVLHVVATLGRGGAETMIMNHYRRIDRRQLQFDFLVNYPQRGEYEDEVEALGGRVYRTMPIRPWSYGAYGRCLDRFFTEHEGEYIAVHAHIQDNSGFVLKYAARHGVAMRIAHSHLTRLHFDLKYPFYMYARRYVRRYTTHRMACGEEAGKFMFGDKPYDVLRNAIDVSRYIYSPSVRARVRATLGIDDDTFVIGHVGRFFAQKNHPMLLRVFAEVHRVRPDALLLLVGTGQTVERMRSLVTRLGVADAVMFLGSRSDVPDLLQAMDTMVFPSLFEGLPVSIIEAQAAGLPCVLSDTIDPATAVTPAVRFISLKAPVSDWAAAVLDNAGHHRLDTSPLLTAAGYDVEANARLLTAYYKQGGSL